MQGYQPSKSILNNFEYSRKDQINFSKLKVFTNSKIRF